MGLRDAARPTALQRIDAVRAKRGGELMPADFFFSKDDQELYFGVSTPCAFNPATGKIREMQTKAGWVRAFHAGSGRLICTDSKTINAVKATNLTLEWSVAAPAGISFSIPVTQISPDGRWVGITGKSASSYSLAMLDTQRQRFVALQSLPQGLFRSMAFSPDSKRIALGHKTGIISCWEIDKVIASSPPPASPPAATANPKGK